MADSTATGKEFLGATAGDTVYFISGTYNPGNAPGWATPAWNPSNSGSSGSPITFKRLSGTCTILSNDVGPPFGANSRNYITWDGFTGSKSDVHNDYVRFDTTDHCQLLHCDITGSSVTASINVCVAAEDTTYLTVENCKLHGSKGTHTQNSAGYMSYSTSNCTIQNNEIYNNHTGIFEKSNGSHNTYKNNFFHDNDTCGFLVGTETTGSTQHNISVYQNVFIDHIWEAINITGALTKSEIYIYNNVIYNMTSTAIYTQGGAIADRQIYNNIIYTAGTSFNLNSSDTSTYNDYNSIYDYGSLKISDATITLANWISTYGFDANSITVDPELSNVGGTSATDYKLGSYSGSNPCYGTGKSDVTIGAYITGSEEIGPESDGATPFTIPSPGYLYITS